MLDWLWIEGNLLIKNNLVLGGLLERPLIE